MYTTILFDLDGTLVDSAEGIKNSFSYVFEKLGLPQVPREEMGVFIGPPLTYSFETICGLSKSESERAVETYREYYARKGIFEIDVFEGIEELLRELHARGKKLVLATSKYEPYALMVLDALGFSKYFVFAAGSEKNGVRNTKAEVISYALEKTGAEKKSSVMVGDRMHDTVGAREAGIDSIGALFGYGTEEELRAGGAKYLARTPADILRIVCGE